LVLVSAKKCFGLIQQVLIGVKFILEYFCGADILAETAISAAAVYGWAGIQRDDVLRTDFQTPLAFAFSEAHPLAKTGISGDIWGLV
jgi:hypothetical protein